MSKLKKILTAPIKPIYLYSAVLMILLSVYLFADINKYVPSFFSSVQSKQTAHVTAMNQASQPPVVSAGSTTADATDVDTEIEDIEPAAGGDWNLYSWSFDEAIEVRVLKPYTLNDLSQFGIEFQVREKDRYAHFEISSDGIIEQKSVPFDQFKNLSIKKTLLNKTAEMFTSQGNESQRLVVEGHIKNTSVMHEFGDSYHVPIKIIDEVKNNFKLTPGKFITLYEVPLEAGQKAIIGKIIVAFTGKHYHFDQETRTLESTAIFIVKDQEIAMHEFSRSSGYALYKNKRGQLYLLLKRAGYEGSGIESYLINSDGLQLMATVGAGV